MPGLGGLGMGPVAVLLPVKSFSEAKLRLAPALPPAARRALARDMATHVLACAGHLPVAVVCDDVEVAAWAREHHALVVWEPERGLNRAVEAGVERLASEGVERVIVAHADLAFASELEWVADFAGVTLVPDQRDNGTNVVGVPARSGFAFSYGPGSFARHQVETRRLGLPLRVVRAPDLARDVDLPSDLAHS
jgi:2-phospho-L-lactate/phosphoenolpyruvate guanylyltransferase